MKPPGAQLALGHTGVQSPIGQHETRPRQETLRARARGLSIHGPRAGHAARRLTHRSLVWQVIVAAALPGPSGVVICFESGTWREIMQMMRFGTKIFLTKT